jgi:DNA-binding NarL/FixJ family response regulator
VSLSSFGREIAASRNVDAHAPRDGPDMSVRCLIVDDNHGFLETASRVLSDGGISVVGVATTTADALARARETQPDVALVDIVLGSESGFDLARQLADEARSAPLKVILISTHAAEDFADLIEASPAIGFLPKSQLSGAAIERIVAEGDGSQNR